MLAVNGFFAVLSAVLPVLSFCIRSLLFYFVSAMFRDNRTVIILMHSDQMLQIQFQLQLCA